MERLDALKQRIAIASRNAIARAAMRLGIEILETDPSKAFGEQKQAERAAKRRRR